jgi:hypothetical protein
MQRSETDLGRVLGHRDPAGGEAGRDQGQLLTDGGGVDAEGSGQVGDRDPTAGGPEAGGEADQVDLKDPHRLGRAEQDVGGGVQAEAAAEALEGADRGSRLPLSISEITVWETPVRREASRMPIRSISRRRRSSAPMGLDTAVAAAA